MIKSGVKTSEFWLTMVATLIGAFMASGMLPENHIALKICGIALAALAMLGYNVSRGIAKIADKPSLVMELVEAKEEEWTEEENKKE